jgi:acyl-CoA synthetase (AMP-forming)/AMP-acid ligase II
VKSVAAVLDEDVTDGDRAVLLYPQPLEFSIGLLASFHAGTVAVPAAVPPRARESFAMARLRSIVKNSAPRHVLCSESVLARRPELLKGVPELARAAWFATDSIPTVDHWQASKARSDGIAFIQYTSGSTSTPKGVRVTHSNLVHNEFALAGHFHQDEQSVVVSWLPTHHDMGLVGCVLNPLFVGGHVYLMPTAAFLKDPHRWLRAISATGANTAAAPDSAYAMCAREISEEEKSSLDLRCWRVAISGGEPVRPSTIAQFVAAFESCGFSPTAFRPSYGLAEATLVVSSSPPASTPLTRHFCRQALKEGRVEECPVGGDGTVGLVSCGHWNPGTAVRIVDPETRCRTPIDTIGEIWVRGGAVAQGYHGADPSDDSVFGAFVEPDRVDGPYCRTGDLGFIYRGDLFISGRLKDLIIVNGSNHHPEDIERSVEEADCRLHGSVAIFSIEHGEEQHIIVVAEHPRKAASGALEPELERIIRKAISERHRLQVHRLLFVRPGAIPKTTSGKVRRHECRRLFLEGELKTMPQVSR